MRAFTIAAKAGALINIPLLGICHTTDRQPTGAHPRNARVRPGAKHEIKSCLGHVFRPNVRTSITAAPHVPHSEADVDQWLGCKSFRKLDCPRHLARTRAGPHVSSVLKV